MHSEGYLPRMALLYLQNFIVEVITLGPGVQLVSTFCTYITRADESSVSVKRECNFRGWHVPPRECHLCTIRGTLPGTNFTFLGISISKVVPGSSEVN